VLPLTVSHAEETSTSALTRWRNMIQYKKSNNCRKLAHNSITQQEKLIPNINNKKIKIDLRLTVRPNRRGTSIFEG
jgi:hypothetical protein